MSAGESPDTPAQGHQFNMESEEVAANAGDSFRQGSVRPTPPAVQMSAGDPPDTPAQQRQSLVTRAC